MGRQEESESQHFAELDDISYRGVIRWSEDGLFTKDESVALKMHFAELLLRYKKLIEAIASCKSNESRLFNPDDMLIRNAASPLTAQELLKFHLTQETEKELSELKSWIDAVPMYFSSAVFRNTNTASSAANTEGGKNGTDQ